MKPRTQYTDTGKSRRCEYMVWNAQFKRLMPCGCEGHAYRRGKVGGSHVGLCPEHAEFVLDAQTLPVQEYNEEIGAH